jgi:hypothetical protein
MPVIDVLSIICSRLCGSVINSVSTSNLSSADSNVLCGGMTSCDVPHAISSSSESTFTIPRSTFQIARALVVGDAIILLPWLKLKTRSQFAPLSFTGHFRLNNLV